MQIHVDATAEPDAPAALARLVEGLGRANPAPPDFLAVHAGAGADLAGLGRGLAATGARALHGGTSCLGVMAGGRMVGGPGAPGLGLFALWDPEGAFGSALAPLGDDPRAAARDAAARAVDAAGRAGEAPELVWLTAAPGSEEAVLAGVEDVVGPATPIVGGSAADDDLSGRWRVFDGAAVLPEGVAVSALFPSRPLSTAYGSGYAPTAVSGLATRVEGRRLHEIDGRPAAEVYAEWTGGAVAPDLAHGPAPILAESTFHPLGRHVAEVAGVPFHLLAHPATAHPGGAIDLFADLPEGGRLTLMTGSAESLVARAGRVAALAAREGGLAPRDVAGALVVFCGGCMLAIRDRMDEVAAAVDAALGGAPALGVFTFGEQGAALGDRNRHGNLMISCVTFAR